MKWAVLMAACVLAFPGAANAAFFRSPTYGGATFYNEAREFSWTFSSSEQPGTEHGGVGYRLASDQNSDQEWHGCLEGPQTVTLSNLPPGEYSILIADDYSPLWLYSVGLLDEFESLCGGPAGGNYASDSFTVSPDTGIPENKPEEFVSEKTPWVAEYAEQQSKELVAAREAELKAVEAHEREAKEAREREFELFTEAIDAEASQPTPCVVPALEKQSLANARRALTRAHCTLGQIRRPRKHRGPLEVTAQHPSRGKRLADGAAVSVTLGASKRR